MARRIAYQGAVFTIAFARERSGACPAHEFFDQLSLPDKAKLMALFQIAGDQGKFLNPEKFGDLGNGLYEFKSFQVRMPFRICEERTPTDSDHARLYQEEG
jgi:hypothetical protein